MAETSGVVTTQSAVRTGYGIFKPLLDARRTVQYDIIKLILKMLH